jgi:hypothetical protein
MYAKEVSMYLEWVGKLATQVDGDQKLAKRLMKILESLTQGVEYCESVSSTEVVGDENLASLSGAVVEAKSKIEALRVRVQAVLS